MIKSCVTNLVPVFSLPLGARLQTALLCAVRPQRGATAMRGRAVHQALPHAFTTAAKALRKTQGFKDAIFFIENWNKIQSIYRYISIVKNLKVKLF